MSESDTVKSGTCLLLKRRYRHSRENIISRLSFHSFGQNLRYDSYLTQINFIARITELTQLETYSCCTVI